MHETIKTAPTTETQDAALKAARSTVNAFNHAQVAAAWQSLTAQNLVLPTFAKASISKNGFDLKDGTTSPDRIITEYRKTSGETIALFPDKQLTLAYTSLFKEICALSDNATSKTALKNAWKSFAAVCGITKFSVNSTDIVELLKAMPAIYRTKVNQDDKKVEFVRNKDGRHVLVTDADLKSIKAIFATTSEIAARQSTAKETEQTATEQKAAKQ